MTAHARRLLANGKGPPSPFLTSLITLKSILNWSGKSVAGFCLVFLFSVLFLNVILRYFFNTGITWAYEIHGLLLPWLVAGGLVMAAAQGRNIAITLVPDMLAPSAQRVLLIGVALVAFVISIGVLTSSTPILRAAQYQTYSTIKISQIWGYFSLIYAFAGMAIIAAIDVLALLLGHPTGEFDPGKSSLS